MAKSDKLNSVSMGTKSRPSGKAMRHGDLGEALNAVDGALAEIETIVDVDTSAVTLSEFTTNDAAAPDIDAGSKTAILYLDTTGTNTKLLIRWQSGSRTQIKIQGE